MEKPSCFAISGVQLCESTGSGTVARYPKLSQYCLVRLVGRGLEISCADFALLAFCTTSSGERVVGFGCFGFKDCCLEAELPK